MKAKYSALVLAKSLHVLAWAALYFMILVARQVLLFQGYYWPLSIYRKARFPATHNWTGALYTVWGLVEVRLFHEKFKLLKSLGQLCCH